MMPEIPFQRILLAIKEGSKPDYTGYSLSREQAQLIKEQIDEHKKRWDDYFKFCVEPRLEL